MSVFSDKAFRSFLYGRKKDLLLIFFLNLYNAILTLLCYFTAQKMKFFIKDFFSLDFFRIWSHLLNKSIMENFIFCAVLCTAETEGAKLDENTGSE